MLISVDRQSRDLLIISILYYPQFTRLLLSYCVPSFLYQGLKYLRIFQWSRLMTSGLPNKVLDTAKGDVVNLNWSFVDRCL